MLEIMYKELSENLNKEMLIISGGVNYIGVLVGNYLDLYGQTEYIEFIVNNKRMILDSEDIVDYDINENEIYIYIN